MGRATRDNASKSEASGKKEKRVLAKPAGIKKKTVHKGDKEDASNSIPTSSKESKIDQSKEDEEMVDSTPVAFEKPLIIGNNDLISQLPSDCLDAVFTLLAQDQLAVLAEVSQTFNATATAARPRAVKRRAFNLAVSQCSPNKITVAVMAKIPEDDDNLHRHLMCINSENNFPKLFSKPELVRKDLADYNDTSITEVSQVLPNPRVFINHLVNRLDKFAFAFESLTFDSICIDNNFVDNFTSFISIPMESIKFRMCAFDQKLGDEDKLRFASFLASAKPGELCIDFPQANDARIFDQRFIREYSKAGEHPKLLITKDDDNTEPIPVEHDLVPLLPRFNRLTASSFFVDANQLLDIVLDRFEVEPLWRAEWEIYFKGPFTDQILARIDRSKYTITTNESLDDITIAMGTTKMSIIVHTIDMFDDGHIGLNEVWCLDEFSRNDRFEGIMNDILQDIV